MIAQVNVSPDGAIVVTLDSDDVAEDEDERSLSGLLADSMLDQCSRVAIETYLALHGESDEDE